ncbi:hypothetical protein NHX12_017716 [Muraenolepis orangiensis]|uniref:Uncharacterized protein n=1 Tax=Muraenolepis orangiensis TaxID=630683 RepID=A0A9Q0IXE6_9TELE|nr:hypothetical protein NHX12_017716 [Muraenolepis orangiensis]
MDDSDQDFDISAKLLRKRVRRKAECPPALLSRKAESPSDDCDPNAAADPGKKKRKKKHLNSSESPSPPRADWASTTTTTRRPEPHTVVVGENARDGGPPGPTGPDEAATDTVVDDEDGGQRARKDQVLWRMQQFKRVAPQSLVHHGGTVLRSPTTTKGRQTPNGPDTGLL